MYYSKYDYFIITAPDTTLLFKIINIEAQNICIEYVSVYRNLNKIM